ncbi:ABC transporter permease [Paenactinomyces guangxiensis]|uniref:Transport permease protein n=2 Tax=Paenactinomyces guangxiensis TaxID=1490290 RepID=A0A7W1WTP5_9BACL|nr:ABC transporter permease [Paenactinomyces guangxiensis]
MYAFVERSFSLIRRYIAWEVVFLFYNVVNTLTIGLIGLMQKNPEKQGEMVLFLVVGALFWGFMSVLFEEVSNSITWERWEGTIEYTFMAPIRRITHLSGMCLFAVLYGIFRTTIVLTAVALFFDLTLGKSNLLSALFVLVVASPAFMGLGLIAAVLPLLSPERGAQATHIIQGVILLVSGIYYPVHYLPEWLQPLSWISPGTYALDSARDALLNGATIPEMWPNLLALLIIGAALIPFGLWIFSVAEKYAMRTGKLKRNG